MESQARIHDKKPPQMTMVAEKNEGERMISQLSFKDEGRFFNELSQSILASSKAS